MKKFGTPIGAGPGNAEEKVGFEDVGTPPAPLRAPGLVAVLGAGGVTGLAAVAGSVPADGPPFGSLGDGVAPFADEEGRSKVPGLVVRARDGDDVLVVAAGVAAELDVEAGGANGTHASDRLAIDSLTGNEIDDSGVPGGTLRVNVSFRPPKTVTVTAHCCADAGVTIGARQAVATTAATAAYARR
jgi:hypothetical protein